jgi:hypothetical protein
LSLSPLPIRVQIIAAPWREDVALRIAHAGPGGNATGVNFFAQETNTKRIQLVDTCKNVIPAYRHNPRMRSGLI